MFIGTVPQFKGKLDKFLELLPDRLFEDERAMGAHDMEEDPTNSLKN